MLNLTFGEQVKIVLSRKGMTIKELAQLIEEGTGKKMSRQNLTQRLSRDNFQEQDMRMIAEILGCPLYLSILEDGTGSEVISNNKKIEDSNIEDAESVSAVREPAIMVEAVEEQPMENERDITIGELVDIHEELDAMAREAEARAEEVAEVAEAAMEEEPEAYVEAVESDSAEETEAETEEQNENEVEDADAFANAEAEAETEEFTEAAEAVEEEPVIAEDSNYEPAQAYAESEYAYEEDVENYDAESYGQEQAYEEPVYEETAYAEAVYEDQTDSQPEAVEAYDEPAPIEPEPVKQEAAPEEKPHGWRSYLKFRRKKEEPHKKPEAEPQVQPAEEPAYEEQAYAEAANYEGEAYEPEYGQYYDQETEPGYDQEYTYADAPGESAEEMERAQMYADAAEDRERGEVNPYTGREYESNSVRMHPKRIGYVQVYDRTEHKWTDMTEWAFLGYQERKKALLGKDYVPPIYLD